MANQYTLKNGGYEPFIGNFGLVPQPPIPEPAAEDNGKVLGVSNGSYALVNGGGGGGTVEPLIVTMTDSGIAASYNEIKTALLSGKTVYCANILEDYELYFSLCSISIDEGMYMAVFTDGSNGFAYSADDADTDMDRFVEDTPPVG